MITREFLDKHLPFGEKLFDVARRLSKADMYWTDTEVALSIALEWMEKFTESKRFPHPPWKTPQEFEQAWPIKMGGLQYKNSMSYMTAQGWPSGHDSQCWYVCVECGFRECIGAKEPVCAAIRAVIVMVVTEQWQNIHPRGRPRLMEMIADEYTR